MQLAAAVQEATSCSRSQLAAFGALQACCRLTVCLPWPASTAMPLCCSPATQRVWPQPVGGGALGRSLQGAGDQQAAQTACAGRACLCEVLVFHRQTKVVSVAITSPENLLRSEVQLKLRVPWAAYMSTPAAATLPSALSKLPCCSHIRGTTYVFKHACIAPICWTLWIWEACRHRPAGLQ